MQRMQRRKDDVMHRDSKTRRYTSAVIKVLIAHGEMEEPPQKRRKKKVTVPKAVSEILLARVNELEKQMAPLEKQMAPLVKEHEEIMAFLRICGEEG